MALFFIISFLASVIGAICGIGGGVIIKPTLDMFRLAGVSTISFLSGCTVLAMSCYSVGKGLLAKDAGIDLKTGTPLAVGASAGGVLGKQMFSCVMSAAPRPDVAGAIQACCLAAITVGTLIYTLKKKTIRTCHMGGTAPCLGIGAALGVMSSFLGIGGGPINLVVLAYFFSMTTKTAAANSLYIILFSQITSLLSTLITRSVPEFEWTVLVLMILGGVCGGIVGRMANKRLNNQAVDKLFIGIMAAIIAISLYNSVQYIL